MRTTTHSSWPKTKKALGPTFTFTSTTLVALHDSPGDFVADEIPAVADVAKAKQGVDAAAAEVEACEKKLEDLRNFTSFADIKQLLEVIVWFQSYKATSRSGFNRPTSDAQTAVGQQARPPALPPAAAAAAAAARRPPVPPAERSG
jgi:hypothetical protein